MSHTTITPEQLHDLVEQGRAIELIDVRTPLEFQEVRATHAKNIPLDRLDPHHIMKNRNDSSDQTLFVICKSGQRGAKACQVFKAAGYANVVNVEGGTYAWDRAGLPVIRGKKVISLERQVRIAAGFLALLGAVLALTVHPYFAGLSAFIGAGLLFAGITDTCGMGMILAKMPWNQIQSQPASPTTQASPKA